MISSDACRLPRLVLLLCSVTLSSGLCTAAVAASDPAEAAPLPTASPDSVGMSAERLDRLTRSMQGYIDRQEVAGTVTLVARRGRIVHFEALGQRDVESGEAMTRDTIFRIASMTKPIASVALMMLWEEGRFQLRDPISDHLPEFTEMEVAEIAGDAEYRGTPYKRVPATRPITFQHVLTHTAGFANTYRGVTKPLYDELRGSIQPGEVVGDMVTRLAELPLNFQPGDRWQYGPSTDVVGRLVEVLSGRSLDQFLRQRIFEPLGMSDTHFYLPADKAGRFPALYRPAEDGTIVLAERGDASSRWIAEPHTYFSGGGGLVSTAGDYLRFLQMLLDGGELDGVRLLSPKTVQLMTTSHIGDLVTWLAGPGYGFGLGFSVVTDKGLSGLPSSLGSYAWGGAFGTIFWVDPVEELIGILMTQIRPYAHLNIRQDLRVLAYQAIIESYE